MTQSQAHDHGIGEMGALLAVVFGALAIGFSPIFVRLSEVGPIATAFWRVALVVPFFGLWLALSAKRTVHPHVVIRAGRRSTRQVLALAGVFFALDLALWHLAIGRTLVANATVLANLTPIVVAAGAVLLFHERLRPLFYIGLAAALIGSAVLAGGSFDAGGARLWGDALAVATALFYGSYLLALGRLRGSEATARVMYWTCVVSAPLLLAAAWLADETILPRSADGWWVVIGLALVTQLFGQGLIAYSFRHLPAAFGSVALLIQTAVAALAAWWLFGESLGPFELTGAFIILLGIMMARRGSTRAAP